MKNERIIDLQNELSKTKDDLISTKAKLESFKKNFSSFGTIDRIKNKGSPFYTTTTIVSNFTDKLQNDESEESRFP